MRLLTIAVLTLLITFALCSEVSAAPTRACTQAWDSAWAAQSGSVYYAGPGQILHLWVQFQNTGCSTWDFTQFNPNSPNNPGILLGTWAPVPGQDAPTVWGGNGGSSCSTQTYWFSCNRIRGTPDVVPPGSIVTFNFDVVAPGTPYSTLHVRPVLDGNTWLPDNGVWFEFAPPKTTARYMSTTDQATMRTEGCAQANESGVVVLDFGQPWWDGSGTYSSSTTGTILEVGGATYPRDFRTIDQIEAAVHQWIIGYQDVSCGGSGSARLAVGTNNYRGASTVSYSQHGNQWAQMVNRINAWISAQGYNRVAARGASDMELAWDTASDTEAWVNGYASAYTGSSYLYNYGDAAGCPPYNSGTSCSNGWTQHDVYYVSYGAPPSYAVPEIYTAAAYVGDTRGGQPEEWYEISLYGYGNELLGAIGFLGVMTEYAASPTTFTPAEGWRRLYDLVNADSRTKTQINYSVDITWAN